MSFLSDDSGGGFLSGFGERVQSIDWGETADTVTDYAEDVSETAQEVGGILEGDRTFPPKRRPVGQTENESTGTQKDGGSEGMAMGLMVLGVIGAFIATQV